MFYIYGRHCLHRVVRASPVWPGPARLHRPADQRPRPAPAAPRCTWFDPRPPPGWRVTQTAACEKTHRALFLSPGPGGVWWNLSAFWIIFFILFLNSETKTAKLMDFGSATLSRWALNFSSRVIFTVYDRHDVPLNKTILCPHVKCQDDLGGSAMTLKVLDANTKSHHVTVSHSVLSVLS